MREYTPSTSVSCKIGRGVAARDAETLAWLDEARR